MKASYLCLLALILIGCTSVPPQHDSLSDAQAADLFRRFEHLHPPFDSATAYQALGGSDWTHHASFYHITILAGFLPLHKALSSGATVGVEFRASTSSTDSGYTAYLHFTAPLDTEAEASRVGNAPIPRFGQKFFGGQISSAQQIDEFALCYPDGHCLDVSPKSRTVIPSGTSHL